MATTEKKLRLYDVLLTEAQATSLTTETIKELTDFQDRRDRNIATLQRLCKKIADLQIMWQESGLKYHGTEPKIERNDEEYNTYYENRGILHQYLFSAKTRKSFFARATFVRKMIAGSSPMWKHEQTLDDLPENKKNSDFHAQECFRWVGTITKYAELDKNGRLRGAN